jgi:hypothetical protein
MGLKELFASIFAVLFRHHSLWQDLKLSDRMDESAVLREYAIPVIAVVQFVKFFLTGNPRQAMVMAIVDFLIDVGALYLLIRGAAYLFERERQEAVTVLCYSMTPVWIFELFYFTGNWSWFFAVSALIYCLVISRNGYLVHLDRNAVLSGQVLKIAAIFLVTVNSAAFLLIKAVMRSFNF